MNLIGLSQSWQDYPLISQMFLLIRWQCNPVLTNDTGAIVGFLISEKDTGIAPCSHSSTLYVEVMLEDTLAILWPWGGSTE